MHADFEIVTPERAKDYLARRDGQRPLSETHVRRLADKMRNGIWYETAEPIHFDEENRLINGQHRLSAIVISGIKQKMLVVRGVGNMAFAKMDQGKKRSASDALAVLGMKNYRHAAVCARILIELRDFGGIRRVTLDNSIVEEFAEDCKEELEEVSSLARSCQDFVSSGVLAAAVFMMGRVNKEMALVFIESLSTGANLSSKSPILLLREKLMKAKTQVGSRGSSPEDIFPLIVSAWNHFRKGHDVCRLIPSKSIIPDGFTTKHWFAKS